MAGTVSAVDTACTLAMRAVVFTAVAFAAELTAECVVERPERLAVTQVVAELLQPRRHADLAAAAQLVADSAAADT
jgi:hypothetical protein